MEKVNQKDNKEPLMPIIKNLEIGESHTYPIRRMNVVKSVVCQVSVMLGRKFVTKLEKPTSIKVTRTE